MFINLLQITFFNKYIISPKIWLHNIKYSNKITILFLYLCFSYYLDYIYIIISIIICLTITLNTKIQQHHIINQLNILFIILTILLNIETMNNNIAAQIQIKIPYNQHTRSFFYILEKIYFNIVTINNKYYLLIVPEYIIRIICLPLFSLLCLKLLFLTTPYEEIIIYIISTLKRVKNKKFKKVNLIIAISSQLLIITYQKIYYIFLSLKLRNIKKSLVQKYTNIYISAFTELLLFIQYNIIRISYILYIRKINHSNFTISNVYNIIKLQSR